MNCLKKKKNVQLEENHNEFSNGKLWFRPVKFKVAFICYEGVTPSHEGGFEFTSITPHELKLSRFEPINACNKLDKNLLSMIK